LVIWSLGHFAALLGLDPFGIAQDKRQIQAKSGDLAIPSEQFWVH